MADSAHIDFSEGSSLQSKARAYQKASAAHRDIENSMEHADADNDWAQRLGSAQELQDAKKIIENSRIQAARSFTTEDIQEATEQELISEQEARQLIAIRRKAEMQERENGRSSSKSRSNSRKR
ncbi:hypothetical protein [Thalassotalea agarivorans]|uniref:Uncharacterized protein n=1 Tax=Thalassotalea agarivorans TaxID=349064 RepID=A0A1I0GKB2_THASX|nr:hypothetical protein [Thalassotalea agarivorans]SET71398.1 hypothetical protein SAMN05660429_02477 [Thalassotalea agarivorans]